MASTVFGHDVDGRIESIEALRDVAKMPSRLVTDKVISRIDPLAARFIAASPLAILSTRRPDGVLDQTPRGDPEGFVKVLDEHTLALPDRPGNNRMDAIENIIQTGSVGLLFLIPGHGDTLRVSGTGAVVQDDALGQSLAVNGRPAGLVVLIRVERVMSHCPKAFIRSRAWHPDAWPDTSGVPSLAELLKAHAGVSESIPELETVIHTSSTERLY